MILYCPQRLNLKTISFAWRPWPTILPVAALNLVLSARLILQHLEPRAAALLHDFAGDFGFGGLFAAVELVVVEDGQDFAEGNFVADLAFELLDFDGLTRRDAVLLAPTSNYGVHTAS